MGGAAALQASPYMKGSCMVGVINKVQGFSHHIILMRLGKSQNPRLGYYYFLIERIVQKAHFKITIDVSFDPTVYKYINSTRLKAIFK